MFTNVGNIFTGQPRHAETADTRKEIRRHDPEHERRKKKKKENAGDDLFSSKGSATVSVEALEIFLNNFLKSQKITDAFGKTATKSEAAGEKKAAEITDRPAHGPAAQAASAYQTAAESNRSASAFDNLEEAPLFDLAADDVRSIHRLMDDLKTLADGKVKYLKITRSDSFLSSLVLAVENAKSSL